MGVSVVDICDAVVNCILLRLDEVMLLPILSNPVVSNVVQVLWSAYSVLVGFRELMTIYVSYLACAGCHLAFDIF